MANMTLTFEFLFPVQRIDNKGTTQDWDEEEMEEEEKVKKEREEEEKKENTKKR